MYNKTPKRSTDKYLVILKELPDIVYKIDLDGHFTFINNYVRILGYEPEELIGQHFSKIIHPDDVKSFSRFIVLPKDKGKVTGDESAPKLFDERRTGKRKTKDLEIRLIPKKQKRGEKDLKKMIGSVIASGDVSSAGHYDTDVHKKDKKFLGTLGIIRDITKRKRAEEELRKSEEKYKTLTENVNVGVYRNMVGPKGKFIEANPAIVKMFGYKSKDEFLSINVADLYQNPENRKIFNEKMLRVGFVKGEELQLRRKDGSPFIGSVSAVAVKDERGKVKYYDGIIEDITERKRAEAKLQQSSQRIRKGLEATVNALAAASEMRDPYTAGHQRRVANLSYGIAKEMGLSEDQITGIHIAAIIHDIGKIHVPAEILSKPSQLTETDFSIIKTHPQAGYDILKNIDFPWPIAEIVLQHHERMDGSGYPKGLSSEHILLEAKILSVADVVEAMSSYRPYRPARGLDVTLEEISKNKGILYDPQVVDVCLILFKEKGFKIE